jgi:two-component system sensor histidine kinase UhpB
MDYEPHSCILPFAETTASSIFISVEDDGIGLPDDFKFGFGFLGMSERVRKLGGHLNVTNGQDAGTLIEAVIPVASAEMRTAV